MSVVLSFDEVKFGDKLILEASKISLSKGEIVGIYGSNGSGKSSLLEGVFTVNAETVYLPQDYNHNILPWLTVRENLACYKHQGASNSENLEIMGNTFNLSAKIGDLSGGQKQILATYFLSQLDRPVFLMDEPFSALNLHYMSNYLIDLKAQFKEKTGVVVSHQLEHLHAICDRVLICDGPPLRFIGELKIDQLTYSDLYANVTTLFQK